jgi:hypothetical protein
VQRWPLGRELKGEIDANLAIPIIPALLVPKTNKFIFLSYIKALLEYRAAYLGALYAQLRSLQADQSLQTLQATRA